MAVENTTHMLVDKAATEQPGVKTEKNQLVLILIPVSQRVREFTACRRADFLVLDAEGFGDRQKRARPVRYGFGDHIPDKGVSTDFGQNAAARTTNNDDFGVGHESQIRTYS